MKNVRDITINDNRYEAYLTIRDLRAVEREIDKSLISIFNLEALAALRSFTQRVDIDFLVACLRYGIHDDKYGKRTDDEIFDLIEEYCAVEGNTIDSLSGIACTMVLDTDLFSPVKFNDTGKNSKATKSKKAVAPSAPSQNG